MAMESHSRDRVDAKDEHPDKASALKLWSVRLNHHRNQPNNGPNANVSLLSHNPSEAHPVNRALANSEFCQNGLELTLILRLDHNWHRLYAIKFTNQLPFEQLTFWPFQRLSLLSLGLSNI